MQYPYPANSNNADSTRNSVKTNSHENQADKEDANEDMNPKTNRHRDTGKSDDDSSNATYAINSKHTNSTKQNLYISAQPIISNGCEAEYSHGKKYIKSLFIYFILLLYIKSYLVSNNVFLHLRHCL